MTIKSRRRVLKGLSAALPAVWARPVVEAVVLPAHAQTSTPVRCSAPAGCYLFDSGSFSWPGGAGPHSDVPFFYGDEGCAGDVDIAPAASLVVATNAVEAQEALGSSELPYELSSNLAPTGGCRFFGIG